jgi:GTPase Era involved in 16S rRNA processing
MSFFKSEVVRAEIAEISDLQEDVYKNVFKFSTMSKEEKLNHVKILERLLEKQKVLYTRLSLSDDPEAVVMKQRISESASMMGLPINVDMNVIFNNMSRMLEVMREQIDKTGTDK